MELVIKIPEEEYKKISNSNPSYADDFNLYYAIKNGTPLPKGHGRCIDVNEITAFRELECNGHNVKNLDEFTTIIENDGNGYHHECLIDMEFKARDRQIYDKGKMDVLDKIRAEIKEHADRLKDSLYGDGMRHCIDIIDKYRGSEKE